MSNNLFLFGNLKLSLDAGFDDTIDHRHNTKDTELITESASRWLREHKRERFFMMVNYNAPHLPYSPPDDVMKALRPRLEGLPEGFSKPYLGEVAWVDEHVSKLMALLDDLKLSERTLVIVTSDHGEIMDPRHECWSRNWKSKCLHQHGKTLFDEEVHVPLVMRLPGRIPPGSTVDSPISHLDLAPTILGMVGVVPPVDHAGRDVSNALMGGTAPAIDAPMVMESRLAMALRWQDSKYIIHDERERLEFERDTLFDRRRSLEELYDLRSDPDELHNLAFQSDQPLLRVMRDKLAELRAAPDAPHMVVAAPASVPAMEPDETPASSAPAPSPTVAAGPMSKLLFHALDEGTRFEGTITSPAAFLEFETSDPTGIRLDDERTVVVNLTPGGTAPTLRFRTVSADAPIDVRLKLDGRPLPAERFYVGPWGLKLYSLPLRITGPADYRLAVSPQTPARGRQVAPGVFYWVDAAPARGGAQPDADTDMPAGVESEESLDEEVRALMKDWGYTGQ